jgi:hypothetical protein
MAAKLRVLLFQPRPQPPVHPLIAKLQQLAVLSPDHMESVEILVDHILRKQADPVFKADMDAKWNGERPWFS